MGSRTDLFGGRYRLLGALGKGGAGEVHRARDERTGAEVALKLLLVSGPEDLARFEREVSAAARVRDPHVVALLDAGVEAGTPWLAFELVAGGSLADRLAGQGRLEAREACALAAQVARGLAAVHAAGLVHRDVKPANVLVDASGRARLADLGLVRSAEHERLTRTGEILGTLEYLAPEQAQGSAVDARADLHGLGALLHALVAGRPPFEGTGLALLRRVISEAPPPLRSLAPDAPARVERLVQRLLAKDPARRGESAAAVALELEALASGEDEPPAASGSVWTAAAVFLAFALGFAALLALVRPRVGPGPAPLPSLAPSPGISSSASPRLATPVPAASPVFSLEPRIPAEVVADVASFRASGRTRLTGVLGRYAWHAPGEVTGLGVAGDGRRAVVATDSGVLARVDLETGRLEGLVGEPQAIGYRSVALSEDGAYAFATDVGDSLLCWRLADGAPVAVPRPTVAGRVWVTGMARLPGGHRIVGGDEGGLTIYDADAPGTVVRFGNGAEFGSVQRTAVDPAGRVVVAGGANGRVRAFSLQDRTPGVSGQCVQTPAGAVAVSPDASMIAWSGREQGRVSARVLASEKEWFAYVGAPVVALAFSLGGERLFVGGPGHVTSCLLASPGQDAVFEPRGIAKSLVAVPAGVAYGTTVGDLGVRAADASSGLGARGKGELASIQCLALDEDRKRILTGDLAGQVLSWDLTDPGATAGATVAANYGRVHALGVAPSGDVLVAAGSDATSVVDLKRGVALASIASTELPEPTAWAGGMDAGGRSVITISRNLVLVRWSFEGGAAGPTEEARRAIGNGDLVAASVGREKKMLFLATTHGREAWIQAVRLGSLGALEAVDWKTSPSAGLPTALALAPKEDRLLVGDGGGTLTVLRTVGLSVERDLDAGRAGAADPTVVSAIAWGKRVAVVAHRSGVVELRDPRNLAAVDHLDLSGACDHATAIALSKDESRLFLGTARGVVLCYELAK